MSTDERFDDLISSWFEQSAPMRLPERVLDATFERTRASRQHVGVRALPDRLRAPRSERALGGPRRVSAAMGVAAVVVVAASLTLGTLAILPGLGGPAPGDPRSAFVGIWASTIDADGGTQTMTIRRSADDALDIVVTDDIATVCSLTSSTMTGTGHVDGDAFVIPTPDYTCDDGSEPRAVSGAPLEAQLLDFTLTRDPVRDVLTDGFGGVWLRVGAQAPVPQASGTTDPSTSSVTWPQTTIEEARQAQELADAGDPRFTWQAKASRGGYQPGQNHPHDPDFFARFLREELGWEDFRWVEAFAHRDGLISGDVVYVRCEPGGANPPYQQDRDLRGCAPTLDDNQYETVKIHVAQPVRTTPGGIWVVTDWEVIKPAEQLAPPSDAEISASLGAFLQARIEGEGAEAIAEVAGDDPLAGERADQAIPLLYATSTGARYERSEFDLVGGPEWPEGRMEFEVRLFAQNDETVVEQVFSLERDSTGDLRVVYESRPDEPGTTENGEAVPVTYGFLDGDVTYRAAYPLEPSQDGEFRGPDRLAIDGLLPNDDNPRRVLMLLADPRPIGPGCAVGPPPADAEALARTILSDPDFTASAPEAVTIGGISVLRMDVVGQPGGNSCDRLLKDVPFSIESRARLYLFDLPEGSSASVLAAATVTDEDSFETVVRWTEPIVGSIGLHAP